METGDEEKERKEKNKSRSTTEHFLIIKLDESYFAIARDVFMKGDQSIFLSVRE